MKVETLPDLKPNAVDGIAAVLRGLLGLVNGGDLLLELILPHIKNQWQDRVTRFAEVLADKLNRVQYRVEKLENHKTISNIIEEGIFQAMRMQSDKRRDELAELIVNTLNQSKINEDASISLIKTLAELNDSEMILLISKSRILGANFDEKHENIVVGHRIGSSSSEDERLYALMYPKYIAHLVELQLLKPNYERQPKSERKNDNFKVIGGRDSLSEWTPTKIASYTISDIGIELLKLIGISRTNEDVTSIYD